MERIHRPRYHVSRGMRYPRAAGLLVSKMNAYYVFLKFAKLWELQQGTHIKSPIEK